ncbi:serine/threonine-protein phosphatase [Nocardioides marmoriginsengisoli]|uniref:Serine/threonine-protein phosphatase n=1 Tax=Nocardioides marmoriginsengisoli TaxID=661483 RepID=A0A3N0CM42_9ACTN|nr:protein phosphatase 2C domain-containing protein [Nocardioides marmoriginsengisoli]RNL64371.1 serine/threonine-protein phosphatase [Nocardioides marmoriginsengisoli]
MLRFSGFGDSQVGLVRTNNEDSAYVGPTCLLVADGVGGGAAGEIASATAAYVVTAAVLAQPECDPATVLAEGVQEAQARVRAGVLADGSRNGMATTLTAVVTDGERFALAHLGDSRGYVLHDGVLTQVTRDHTYVQDLLDEGRLEPDAVVDHPWRNVVLRTVNGTAEGEPDLIALHLEPGDRVLLASDGLTDLVGDDELTRFVLGRSDDQAVEALVAAALARGGRDNVTCVVATVVDGPRGSDEGTLHGAVTDPTNVVDENVFQLPR